jgi:hypothetical protein
VHDSFQDQRTGIALFLVLKPLGDVVASIQETSTSHSKTNALDEFMHWCFNDNGGSFISPFRQLFAMISVALYVAFVC